MHPRGTARWLWLMLSAFVSVIACGVLLTLQHVEHQAREREMAARLFADKIQQASATISPVAFELASSDRDLLMQTIRRAAVQAEQDLGELRGLAPQQAAAIERQLATISAFADRGSFSATEALEVAAAGARIADIADAVAAEQRKQANVAERLSLGGSLLALALAVLIVGNLVSRDRRRTMQRERAHAEALVAAAQQDPLTGLPNRLRFTRDLQVRERAGAATEIAICDLNDFKEINHRLGHEAGDAVLITVASDLASALSGDAHVYRTGGDQFSVIGEPGARVAERMRVVLERDRERALGSVGAAAWPADHEHIRDAVRIADERMYAVKRVVRREPEPGADPHAGAHDSHHDADAA